MKAIAMTGLILFGLGGCCAAADLNPKVLRLIGGDTRVITCVDFGRQQNSVLHQIIEGKSHPVTSREPVAQILWLRGSRDSESFSVLLGKEPDEAGEFAALAPGVRVAGNADSVREAQRRWSADHPLSPLAVKARRLAQSYDNWFLVVKPLAVMVEEASAPLLPHRQDLMEAVEEVSGGIRFGAVNEIYVEAVFRSTEDASAVATLARWIPGLLQMKGPQLGFLVEAMENFTVHASGQRAFLSARIPEDKLRELAEKWNGRVIE